jgi:NAD(P)-dependent dehydrogenase (short-subunit alcohol dehydrogenase family)
MSRRRLPFRRSAVFWWRSRRRTRMLPNKHGAILFTGASASVKGYPQSAPFAMGKFALRGLAQSMARELSPQGIMSRISSSTAASAARRVPNPPTGRTRCSIPTRLR